MSIVEERAQHYGPATPGSGSVNIARTAALWSAYTGAEITPHDVCWMMVLLKASRSRVDPFHGDNYTDAHGYVELAERHK